MEWGASCCSRGRRDETIIKADANAGILVDTTGSADRHALRDEPAAAHAAARLGTSLGALGLLLADCRFLKQGLGIAHDRLLARYGRLFDRCRGPEREIEQFAEVLVPDRNRQVLVAGRALAEIARGDQVGIGEPGRG